VRFTQSTCIHCWSPQFTPVVGNFSPSSIPVNAPFQSTFFVFYIPVNAPLQSTFSVIFFSNTWYTSVHDPVYCLFHSTFQSVVDNTGFIQSIVFFSKRCTTVYGPLLSTIYPNPLQYLFQTSLLVYVSPLQSPDQSVHC